MGGTKATSGKKTFVLTRYVLFRVPTSYNTGQEGMDSGYTEG